MRAPFVAHDWNVAGSSTRVWRAEKTGKPAVLFVHGGVPGLSPICTGAHIWDSSIIRFADYADVLVPDLPGHGCSMLRVPDAFMVAHRARFLSDLLRYAEINTCHVVAHDAGALAAIELALQNPSLVRSLSIVASHLSTPIGDQLDDILYAAAPLPYWSRSSQAWALDRASYSPHHIDDDLLNACASAASSPPHGIAAAAMRKIYGPYQSSVTKTKSHLWHVCRESGFPVPTQLVWASDDPSAPREGGYALFRIIAARQPAAQFHVINRAGSYVYREQPEAFHQVVSSFHAGIDSQLMGGACS